MGCKVVLGDICSFSRGASIPRARMHDTGDYLYIHYGDLYKGFDLRIDVESPSKPIPFILRGERLKKVSALKIRTSCMCLLRKLLMIWDMLIFSTIHKISLLFRVLRRLLSVLNAEILLYLPISTTL